MGSQPSREESSCELFNELCLVLIGAHGAGKNTAANTILGRKKFRIWSSHNKSSVKLEYRKITIVRTPGWKNLKTSEKKTKKEIVKSVRLTENGPNAILLVLKIEQNSIFGKTEQSILEKLLSVRVWNHVVVIFTNGKALKEMGITIEDYIRDEFDMLMQKCSHRFLVLNSDSDYKDQQNNTVEYLETLIAGKKDEYFSLDDNNIDRQTTLKNKMALSFNLKSKIQKLKRMDSSRNHNLIRKYKDIIQQKCEEIEELKHRLGQENTSNHQPRDCSNTESNDEDDRDSSPLINKTHDQETSSQCIQELKKQLAENDQEVEELKNELMEQKNKETDYKYELEKRDKIIQDLKAKPSLRHRGLSRKPVKSQTIGPTTSQISKQLEMQPLNAFSEEEIQNDWRENLLNILCSLNAKELKRFKFFTQKYNPKISSGLLETADPTNLSILILSSYGFKRSITITRDILKKIPRNDLETELIPFLTRLGTKW